MNFQFFTLRMKRTDVLFLKRAFTKAGISNPVKVATDGQQAIDYLAGSGAFADRQQNPFPGLVLLDLKLPHKSGLEVLKWIRARPELKNILVVIYTSSSQRKDVENAYQLGANGYLVKQGDPDQFAKMAVAFRDYWLIYNEPPSGESAHPMRPIPSP